MKIYVIGDVTVDHLYHLEAWPQSGGEVVPVRSAVVPGGSGGTLSVTLARLGHSVVLATRVGKDPLADVALSLVRETGVSEVAVQYDSEALTSTVTVLQTPPNVRTMMTDSQTSRRLDPKLFKKKELESSQALVVNGYSLIEGAQREYALTAIEVARQAKKPIPVFIDLGTGAVNKIGTQLLSDVVIADYLTLNQHELLALTGTQNLSAALTILGEAGAKQVAVKVGKMGSVVWTPEETELVEAYRTTKPVIDTTGAGDTFTAVFAHGVLSGQSPTQAARAANVAGALASSVLGAQQYPVTLQELEAIE